MKSFFLACLMAFGAVAAWAQNYNEFVPIGPAPIDYVVIEDMKFSDLARSEKNNDIIINLLPNELIAKSIITQDEEGNFEFSAIDIAQNDYTYLVKTDYIKYTTIPVRQGSTDGSIIGIARVGVGVRIEVTLRPQGKAKDLNVADLYRLGYEASHGHVTGNIMMSIMGIESEEVTSAFPVNAEISPTSVAAVLQTMAMVKQAIYDKDSHLTPQVLEIKYTQEYKDQVTNIMDLTMPILLPNENKPSVVIR